MVIHFQEKIFAFKRLRARRTVEESAESVREINITAGMRGETLIGSVPPKFFLPSAPYGASPAANALNPSQSAAINPQQSLLPPNFQSGGTLPGSTPAASNPLSTSSPAPLGNNQNGFFGSNPILKGLFGMQ